MTDRVTIAAASRTVTGKKVKQLRHEGLVPGVIYGQRDPINIQMDIKPLRRALREVGTTQLADLDVDGKTFTVLAREIQQHLTRRDILHVDFMEVDLKQVITSTAELVGVGIAAPEEDGDGTVAFVLFEVDIEALPEALVPQIKVDLSQIQTVNDVILVGDLVVPEGVTILTDPEAAAVRFQVAMGEEIEEELEELEEGEFEEEDSEEEAEESL